MKQLMQLIVFASVFFNLTSCSITEQIRSLQVEVMKPGAFIFPENIKKVAIFKRNLYKSDTAVFKYFYKYYNQYAPKIDSTISYSDLSVRCVDELANFLIKDSYFDEVKNYRDSLNYLWSVGERLKNSDERIDKTDADVCIFLDYFNFYDASVFDERMVTVSPMLIWTVILKADSTSYIYNQADTLTYGSIRFPEYFTGKVKIKDILQNSSQYLAQFFGSKIVPTWLPVERMYYGSDNSAMTKAEGFARKNDWLKAAEIWKQETKNKNQRIVAKACYNMALAAEMEGKPDLAIAWLVKSYSALSNNNREHKANCQRYINVLALRKKEIERLDKQIRKPENVLNQVIN